MATAVNGAITEGFQALAQDRDSLGEQIAAGAVDYFDLFKTPSAGDDLQLLT